MPRSGNLLDAIAAASADEQLDTLLATPELRIERIVSHGHASPAGFWYDQAWDEWVLVLAGSARLRLEGEAAAIVLGRGDFIHLRAGQRHRVEWTDPAQPTIWLALHFKSAIADESGGAPPEA